MSIIATAVRHLMAAGVTGDALFAAIAEMEAQIRTEPKPRSASALRQERYRRNKASHVTVSDGCDGKASQVTVGDAPALSPSPNENNSNPHPHTHPDNKPAREEPLAHRMAWTEFMARKPAKIAKAARNACEMPIGWKPQAFGVGTKSREIVDTWSTSEFSSQFEHFSAHHRSKGSKFKDWQDAWSTWVLNSRKWPAPRRQERDGLSTGTDPMVASILAKRRAAA